jgi:hypothetical protein
MVEANDEVTVTWRFLNLVCVFATVRIEAREKRAERETE